MKIIELRFKNLNSLYGEWLIDFTQPEYTSNGIFAMTGPTGSGKSTILDAICLALYGATPRLNKITKSTNEIMSRQTGECFAEVVFESQTGQFRCHWEQRRSRKKADGALQTPEHQIADAKTGKLIETKKSLVPGIIEEKTGMDFERFTRSILLAQGGFDTFLKAEAEQKSKILEQITGTAIYSEISKRVHNRQREEQENLNILLASTSGIEILTTEAEKEITDDLKDKQKNETAATRQSAELGKSITWLTTINDLKKELDSLINDATQIQTTIETFKPEREKLDKSLKAAELDSNYATLTTARKQQVKDQASLETESIKLPELETTAAQRTQTLKTLEQKHDSDKKALKEATPLMQEVRFLDQSIAEQKAQVAKAEADDKKERSIIESQKKQLTQEQTNLQTSEKNSLSTKKYLAENAQDEWLISGLAGIEEQCNSLAKKQEAVNQQESTLTKDQKTLKSLNKNLDDANKKLLAHEQTLKKSQANIQQAKEALDLLLDNRLLREHRTEKENLLREMALLTKIAELEDHRKKLEDGKPCPLCGAEKHPYAEGNAPEQDKTEKQINALTTLIQSAEDKETEIKKLTDNEKALLEKRHASEKDATLAATKKDSTEKAILDGTKALSEHKSELIKSEKDLLTKLQPLGIQKIKSSNITDTITTLKKRFDQWQNHSKNKLEMEKQMTGLSSEIKKLEAILETQNTAFSQKQTLLKESKTKYKSSCQKRQEIYQDKNPTKEEQLLNEAIENSDRATKQAKTQLDALQGKLTATKTNIDSLNKRIEQQTIAISTSEKEFHQVIQSKGFESETQFKAAILHIKERDELTLKARKLDDEQTNIKAKQKDRQQRLTTEVDKKITDKTLESLTPLFEESEEALKELREMIIKIKHQLAENIAAKERIKEKQASIDAQKKECQRWEKLHSLIGSADGKKFRNFAQGLTFELMVSHANQQLKKMSDRYLLIRSEELPLALNIIDNYQAGEIRSTKNLSGGESFIVSLTLALGLSKMASQKVRVDSLFLDEGFGTLDEEALETALETLSNLQQDGKLIGIISHVPALKERISTQITLTPGSGGKSTLSGPGCQYQEKKE